MKRSTIVHVRTLLVSTILIGLSFGSANAQTNYLEGHIDDYVRAQMTKQKIPGLALAVIKDGKPLVVKDYGLANVELNVPITPETIFQSASMGKQFTSTAVMLLVEEGKIGLDERISKYVGEVPDSWKNITVRQALTHTSGMPNDFTDEDHVNNWTEDQILAKAKAMPLVFAPGTSWAYSNVGYVVLGIMVGKVSGKFYGDFLQERVFKPLSMNTTRIISEADIIPNRAAGYRLVKGELKNQEWVSPTMNTTADGSLYWSILDLVKWDAALSKGLILKTSSWDSVYTPVKLASGTNYPYGFGWSLGSVNGRHLIEHSGAWQGFTTNISRYVDDRVTVIALTNLAGGSPVGICHSVAELVDPDLIEKSIADNDAASTAAHRKLLATIVAGTPVDKEMFSAEAQAGLLPRIEATRERNMSLGPIEKFDVIQRVQEGDTVRHRYLVKFKDADVMYSVVIDKQGKIASIRLTPK